MTSAVFFKNAPVSGLQLLQPAEDERGILARVYLQGPKKDLGSALSGPVTIDLSDEDVIRNDFHGKLAGNVQVSFSNPPSAMRWHVELEQADAGGKTVSWQESVVWLNSGGAPAMPMYAGEKAIYTFRYDGTTIYGTQSYLGYPSRRTLFLPHAHGIQWSSTGAPNGNCSIIGGADDTLPDGVPYVAINSLTYNAAGGHIFYGKMHLQGGSFGTLLNIGATTTWITEAGNPTNCLVVGGGGVAPTAPVFGSFIMWAAQIGGGDQCPHILTANNKLLRLFQGVKSAYTGGGAWTAGTLAQYLVNAGFLDEA